MEFQIPAILPLSILAGAFGGIAAGIIMRSSNKIRLPFSATREIELGLLGDGFIGAAASLSICIVAIPAFSLSLESPTAEDIVNIISMGVVSGFVGERILKGMALRPDEKLAGLDARLNRIDKRERALELTIRGDELLRSNRISQADATYDQILEFDPENARALIGKAKVQRRRGKWEQAIETLTRLIKSKPTKARAYYNRACYKAQCGKYTTEEALNDLKKAIEFEQYYKEYAPQDEDFKNLWGNPEFQRIVQDENIDRKTQA